MKILKFLSFVVFATFLTTGTMRADNLLLNANFSPTGSLPNSCGTGCSFSVSTTGMNTDSTTIPDWTISSFNSGAGIVNLTSGSGNTESSQYPLPSGSTFAFMSGGVISQTVSATATPGNTYTLTLWEADQGAAYNQFDIAGSIYNGSGGGLATTYGNGSAAIAYSGDWTELEVSYVDTFYSGPLTVELYESGGSGQAAFTDVCLTDGSCSASTQSAVTEGGSAMGFLLLAAAVTLGAMRLSKAGMVA
jgi:hypothetical protein